MSFIIHHPKSTSKSAKGDRAKLQFNSEEKLFVKEREYMKALNYTKLDKLFAKPYLFSLIGHRSGIKILRGADQYICSLSFDNSIFLWNIKRKEQIEIIRFKDVITSIAISESKIYFASGNILYEINGYRQIQSFNYKQKSYLGLTKFTNQPHKKIYLAKGYINNLIFKNNKLFILSTDGIEEYYAKKNYAQSINIKTIDIADKFIAATDGNELILIDIIINKIFLRKKIGMKITSIAIKDNLVYSGNGNHNIYIYDIKKGYLNNIVSHIRSVTAIFIKNNLIISGSFDGTIHIRDGDNRYIYHTKQMGSINSLLIVDNFVLSGSTDGDIRAWKLNINKKMEIVSKRETENLKIKQNLLEKYKYGKEIKRIRNHLNVPKKYKEEMKQQFEKNLNKF